jgi:hypothetical protein
MATRWRWPPESCARLALQQVAQLQDLGGLVARAPSISALGTLAIFRP